MDELDSVTLAVLVAIAAIQLIVSARSSRINNPLWLCDPRGLFSIALFLASVGIPIYALVYGRLPTLFGLEASLVVEGTVMLVAGALGYLIGTYLPSRELVERAPALPLDDDVLRWLIGLLSAGVVVTAGILYWQLLDGGLVGLLARQYGADQWLTVDDPPWMHLSVLLTPLLATMIVAWGMTSKSYLHPLLLLMVAIDALPAVFLGGRKDVVMLIIAFGLSRAIRKGRTAIKPLVKLAAVMLGFVFVQSVSRGGESLSVADRLSALSAPSDAESDNSPIAQACIALPILPTLTAVMSVYSGEADHTWGLTYLQTAANVAVPRLLTGGGNMFDPPTVTFHDLYYADVLDFGMDYALAAEGFQNFGFAGVVFAYLMLGIVLATSYEIASRRRNSVWTFVHLNVFMSGLWAIRSDSNASIKAAGYGALCIIALYLVAVKLNATFSAVRRGAKAAGPGPMPAH